MNKDNTGIRVYNCGTCSECAIYGGQR